MSEFMCRKTSRNIVIFFHFFQAGLKSVDTLSREIVRMFSNEESEDFYSDEADVMTRGATLMNSLPQIMSERMNHEVDVVTPVGKCCSRFPQTVSAPTKSKDPLYVFTRWTMLFKSPSVADLANAFIECIESTFSRNCTMMTNIDKVKISLETLSTELNVKIKFFSLPSDPSTFMVMFRKDSGDWFAFNTLFSSCIKYVSNKGILMHKITE